MNIPTAQATPPAAAVTDPTAPATQTAPPAPAAVVTHPAAPPAMLDAKGIADQAIAQERARLTALDALSADWPEHKALIDRCKGEGSSVLEAKDAILGAEAKIKQAALATMRAGGQTTQPIAGANADTPTTGAKAFSAEAVTERFKSDSAFAAKYRSVDDAIDWERARHEASQEQPRR